MEPAAGAKIAVKYMAKFLPSLVRWRYPADRLASLLDVQPAVMEECATLDLWNHEARCWLTVTNLSPFELTLDRIEVVMVTDGASAVAAQLIPETVQSSTKQNVYCRGLFVCQPNGLDVAKKAKRMRLEIRAFVRSKVSDFPIRKYVDAISNFRVNG